VNLVESIQEFTKGVKTITGKVDVYSYGLIVWEMLTGKVPFHKEDKVTAAGLCKHFQH
jgi:serine/threonine protein kinase